MAEIKLNAEDVYTAVNTINGNIADMSSMVQERYSTLKEMMSTSKGDFKEELISQLEAENMLIEQVADLFTQTALFIEKAAKSFEKEDQDVGSQIK